MLTVVWRNENTKKLKKEVVEKGKTEKMEKIKKKMHVNRDSDGEIDIESIYEQARLASLNQKAQF